MNQQSSQSIELKKKSQRAKKDFENFVVEYKKEWEKKLKELWYLCRNSSSETELNQKDYFEDEKENVWLKEQFGKDWKQHLPNSEEEKKKLLELLSQLLKKLDRKKLESEVANSTTLEEQSYLNSALSQNEKSFSYDDTTIISKQKATRRIVDDKIDEGIKFDPKEENENVIMKLPSDYVNETQRESLKEWFQSIGLKRNLSPTLQNCHSITYFNNNESFLHDTALGKITFSHLTRADIAIEVSMLKHKCRPFNPPEGTNIIKFSYRTHLFPDKIREDSDKEVTMELCVDNLNLTKEEKKCFSILACESVEENNSIYRFTSNRNEARSLNYQYLHELFFKMISAVKSIKLQRLCEDVESEYFISKSGNTNEIIRPFKKKYSKKIKFY